MSLQPKPILTFDDWLAGERAALESRSEYIDGEVAGIPISGGGGIVYPRTGRALDPHGVQRPQ